MRKWLISCCLVSLSLLTPGCGSEIPKKKASAKPAALAQEAPAVKAAPKVEAAVIKPSVSAKIPVDLKDALSKIEFPSQKRLEGFYQTRSGRELVSERLNETPVSIAAGVLADSTVGVKSLIQAYLNMYPGIRSQADEFDNPEGGLEGYETFNKFFTRPLSALGKSKRPIDKAENVVVSPADSRLFAIENLQPYSDFFVKGVKLNLEQFLGNDRALADSYKGGTLLLFYLSPEDYHRFHFPFDATIVSGPKRITTKELDSVDPIAYTPTEDSHEYASRWNVFSKKPYTPKSQPLLRNERQLLVLGSKEFGDVLFMAVGAMNVGKIGFSYPKSEKVELLHKKGDEMGYFAFGGSTIVLIFPPRDVQVEKEFIPVRIPEYKEVYQFYTKGGHEKDDPRPRKKVKLGQAVAKKIK